MNHWIKISGRKKMARESELKILYHRANPTLAEQRASLLVEATAPAKEAPCGTMKHELALNRRVEELFLRTILNGRLNAKSVPQEG